MSKEEIDIEVAKIRTELSHLKKLIQKRIREEWKQGFYLGKRVKWSVRELFAQKLILQTIENEIIESICEPKKGPLLGEGDSDEEMIYTDQHERKVLVASSQTRESHIFGINYLC